MSLAIASGLHCRTAPRAAPFPVARCPMSPTPVLQAKSQQLARLLPGASASPAAR